MLKLINIDVENAIAFEVSGKITKGEMDQMLSETKSKAEKFDDIVFYEEIVSFKGIEISAIVKELKFLRNEGFSKIKKAAVVTDKTWIQKVSCIKNSIFKNVVIRCFHSDEKEKAIEFLKCA